jgi:hypothetical protein
VRVARAVRRVNNHILIDRSVGGNKSNEGFVITIIDPSDD